MQIFLISGKDTVQFPPPGHTTEYRGKPVRALIGKPMPRNSDVKSDMLRIHSGAHMNDSGVLMGFRSTMHMSNSSKTKF